MSTFGLSHFKGRVIYKPGLYSNNNSSHDGTVDSLRQLIMHEQFLKPWSSQHILTTLLTKSF